MENAVKMEAKESFNAWADLNSDDISRLSSKPMLVCTGTVIYGLYASKVPDPPSVMVWVPATKRDILGLDN